MSSFDHLLKNKIEKPYQYVKLKKGGNCEILRLSFSVVKVWSPQPGL